MTVSNVTPLRPADSPPPGPEWKQVAGYSGYEWSHRGPVRSVDREVAGRKYRGVTLKQRRNNSGYLVVNVTNDQGVKETVLVHRMILLAHAGEFGPGEETLHGPGGQLDNRYPENLRKDTHERNVAERVAANPARPPKPPKACINHSRCGGYVVRGGRRCHECRVHLGHAAAVLFERGADPEQVARALNYGNANGIYRVAVQLGGLRCYIAEDAITLREPDSGYTEQPISWLRSVINRAQTWLADSDAQ
jgi:hypothetical protein